MTEELFREDAYLKSCMARIVAVNERGGLVLDRTVFYPTGGGQPGDRGSLKLADGREIAIATTVYDSDGRTIVHVPADGSPTLAAGDAIEAVLDWDRRYRLMRAHTALHLLCAVVAYPVTGGQVGEAEGRLDFDIPEQAPDKQEIADRINAHVAAGRAISHRWITDAEMAERQDLVRTMKVKPPAGRGRVRLVEIADCDLQPCGGTHVASTAEVGLAAIEKIEKKGAINRRIRLRLA